MNIISISADLSLIYLKLSKEYIDACRYHPLIKISLPPYLLQVHKRLEGTTPILSRILSCFTLKQRFMVF